MVARRHRRHRRGRARRAFDAISRAPLWAKLAVLAVLIAAIGIGIRHYRATMLMPPSVFDRTPLLRDAETQLRNDPEVADVVYSPANDQWNASPRTVTGPAEDFGRYVCVVLTGAGVVGPHTSVRVIDAAQLAANGFDYSAAATSTVICDQGDDR